jgi:hypothetical protein
MNIQRLLNDYEALEQNEFYKLVVEKLVEFSRGRSLALRDAPLDKVARLQGELSAIDWALSRPGEIVKSLTKENETQNG